MTNGYSKPSKFFPLDFFNAIAMKPTQPSRQNFTHQNQQSIHLSKLYPIKVLYHAAYKYHFFVRLDVHDAT